MREGSPRPALGPTGTGGTGAGRQRGGSCQNCLKALHSRETKGYGTAERKQRNLKDKVTSLQESSS